MLILPELTVKIVSDLMLYVSLKAKPNWLKLKLVMVACLTLNAFVFLVPMMPELVLLAKASIPSGVASQELLDKGRTEQIVGLFNVVLLLVELVLGSFKPKSGRARKINS